MRVLVVDDDPDVIGAMTDLIRTRYGIDIVIAKSGPEAMNVIGDGRIDHVLTDQCMPKMNGDTLLARLRKEHPSIKATMMTALRDNKLRYRVEDMGYDFIEKGSDLDDLLQVFDIIRAQSRSGNVL